MVTKKVIDTLYKKYRRRPDTPDELDIALLFEELAAHGITIEGGDDVVIHSISPDSPFHRISLGRIHAIVNFADEVAIVLHSSVIFLNKADNKVFVHIKEERPSLIDRLRFRFSPDNDI